MVKHFVDFDKAYAEWREDGGAMNGSQAHLPGEADTWYVGTVEEIAEMVICSQREATEAALAAGGMTDAEIETALADWQD